MSSAIESDLSEEQRLVLATARDFAKQSVEPLARKIDAEHYYPQELIPELGKLGFLGVTVSDEFGGSGLDNVSYALIVEELARVCASTSVIVSAHNSLCLWPLEKYGSVEQKKRYLPSLCAGTAIGCFALSEPGTGSDAARQTCMARRDGDGWVINGVKNWITNAPVSDVCILFTMENAEAGHKGINAFIIELKNTPGVSIGKKEDKLGICGSPTASIIFEQARVSNDQLLGKPGEGFKIAMSTLDGGRIGIAAQATGIGRAALEDALKYSRERKAFGSLISEHQSIQNHLADMSVRVDAARLLTHHAARRNDAGRQAGRQAADATLYASEAAVWCALKGIQVHGGYGYVKDFNAERYLRDAKITEIYEGTS
ncbi:MAG: acyl-CoA dehydrogenase family protein, partial [Deltaproteobacteria bacterium]|nr:acyl-CoA dehydrogenase family protein [Deltaproteobacteria bacterium]